jgi:hypothetical protein
MSLEPKVVPFQADASDSLLSLLRKFEQCDALSADERFEINGLKFLVLRARLRAARGLPTLTDTVRECLGGAGL